MKTHLFWTNARSYKHIHAKKLTGNINWVVGKVRGEAAFVVDEWPPCATVSIRRWESYVKGYERCLYYKYRWLKVCFILHMRRFLPDVFCHELWGQSKKILRKHENAHLRRNFILQECGFEYYAYSIKHFYLKDRANWTTFISYMKMKSWKL